MKTIYDPVFGALQYDCSWQKEEDLYFRNKTTKIKVVVEADVDQELLDVQRQQYLFYEQKKNEYISALPKVLLQYYLDNYDSIAAEMDIPEAINKENINEQSVTKLIKINAVYFARNGRYGWLCDCAWDTEHGLCILLSEKEPCIREQDRLI